MNQSGLKVLHVAETIKGGIASYLSELIPLQIAMYGINAVSVLVPDSHLDSLANIPAQCISSFKQKGGRLLSSIYLTAEVIKILETNNISILHIHSSYAGLMVRPFVWFSSKRPNIIYCAHGWAFDRESGFVVRAVAAMVERVLSYACDVIVCISEHELSAGLAIGIHKPKLKLVNNGILLLTPYSSEPISWPDNRLRILFVGRFDHQKGFDLLLEAMAQLRDIAFAIMIGEPVVNDPIVDCTPDNVAILGWKSREELDAYYKGAEVFVMPSRWEGFGLTAIEAMRQELPVFASAVGGLQDVVDNGVTGVLFPANSSQAIVDALRCIDREKIKQMGKLARKRFEDKYTADRMAKEIDVIYRNLVTY
jgi:glycosyltransferase involved in cell wall biosynthesis